MYTALRGCNLITLNQQSFSRALAFTPVCLALRIKLPDFNIYLTSLTNPQLS